LEATYTGTGSIITEGGVDFYISKSIESPTSAVLLLPDIWGWNGGRIRAIADYWAKQGYMAIIPKLLTPVFEGGTDGDAMSPTSVFNMDWMKLFPWSVQKPKVDTALKLCKDKGIVKIAVLGFCYGGHPASWASSENPDLIVCGAVFHPSMQLETYAFGGNMLDLMKGVKCPFLIAPAGGDLPMFAEDGEFGEALKSSAKGSACIWKVYEEMSHGWSVRGDIADEKIKRDCEAVMKEATEFFAKYL
jgi:dienelactone hydrolase